MKVILKIDVKNYGKKNEIVEVNDGYARNFLIPRKMAVEVTKASLERYQYQQALDDQKHEENIKKAQQLAESLKHKPLEFYLKSGQDGRVFGAISNKQIIQAMAKNYQITLDKKQFKDTSALSSLGNHRLIVDLYDRVSGELLVVIKGQD